MSDYYSENTMSQLSLDNSLISQLSENEEKDEMSEFVCAFNNIFSQKKNDIEKKEEKMDENKLYYINNDIGPNSEKSTKTQTSNIKKVLFNTKKEEEPEFIQKKRGRFPKPKDFDTINGAHKIHDKNAMDNLLRKIQVHFLNFIISYINDILKVLNYKEQFLKIDYNFKKNINKDFMDNLKTKKISDIVCIDISSKYKKQDKNENRKIYEKIKKKEYVNNILNQNYLEPFDIYYKSKKKINLINYGLDQDIILSDKSKMFKDLLKECKNNEENNEDYIKNLNFCISQNYPVKDKFLMYNQTI